MPTAQNKTYRSTDDLLRAVSQLKPKEFEKFLAQTLVIRAKRNASNLSRRESELLLKINKGLPARIQKRFDELNTKRENATLTKEEHQELLRLINRIENQDAKRIEMLGELAQIRQQPIRELMKELGIGQIKYV